MTIAAAEALEKIREALEIARKRIDYLGVNNRDHRHYEANEETYLPMIDNALALLPALSTARSFGGDEPHADDEYVDSFAHAMKMKLAAKRKEGRGGWDSFEIVSNEQLAAMLFEHLPKGDPIDLANYCMMLWVRCGADSIRAAQKQVVDAEGAASEILQGLLVAEKIDCLSVSVEQIVAMLRPHLRAVQPMTAEERETLVDEMCREYWGGSPPMSRHWDELEVSFKAEMRGGMSAALAAVERRKGAA